MLWEERKELISSPAVDVPPLISRWLARRGLGSREDIDAELNPRLKDLTHPFKIKNLEMATERVLKARSEGELIALYGDFDLDGTAGLALLRQGLRDLGFDEPIIYQPLRLTEGYGLHVAALENLASQGVKVVITVDVGITGLAAAKKARELGIDLIITDHHQPAAELPRAFAVINPNQLGCESGLGHLCGAGVALFLLLGLKIKMQESGLRVDLFDYRQLLDFFVIATLTDMVPLKKENRILVKHGVLQLERTRRPGLRRLLENLGLAGKKLSANDVAIRFAPKLNALSRLEEVVRPFDLMTETNDVRAALLVDTVLGANEKRIKLQNEAVAEARSILQKRPPENCIVVWSKDFHRGVVGLVAARLAGEFGLPAFVGATESDGRTVGSARLAHPEQTSLLLALESAREYLVKFGGHDPAAGFEFKYENGDKLRSALERFYGEIKDEAKSAIAYDCEAQVAELDSDFRRWFDLLAPFGVGFPEPVFLFSYLVLAKLTELRGGHFKLRLKESTGTQIDALWFSPPAQHAHVEVKLSEGEVLNVLASPQWNEFRGSRSLQLVVKDLKVV